MGKEGERPGKMGAFPLFVVSKAIRGSWDEAFAGSAWGICLRQSRRRDGRDRRSDSESSRA
jgi:hypothetical protein